MNQLPILPITYDLISVVMLAGILQSFFLGLTLLLKAENRNQVLILWGLFVLITGIISLDLYLCYTGLMQHVLRLNDSTEFLSLLTAPLLFLVTKRMMVKKEIKWREIWPHMIVPGLYLLNMYFFWRQPMEAMYNSYIDAYFPALEHLPVASIGSQDPLMIKGKIDWWILFSFMFYLFLSIKLVRNQGFSKMSGFNQEGYTKYGLIKNTLIGIGLFLAIFVIIETFNDRDAGDYILSLIITVQSFGLTYFIISNSKMLDQQWLADKYETSGIGTDQVTELFQQLIQYVESEQFSFYPGENQETIAKRLNTSKSYLSRAMVHSKHKNFNDFINHYRVALAMKELRNPDNLNFTIESIGKQVGFGSKSTFYNAFKKEVGITPAAFAKDNRSG